MLMTVYVLGLAGCAVVLLFASKIVYREIVTISTILRVPAFLVSLVLVALSTSIPELFVGITSAIEGTPSFSLGDILGSNIVNLTFIAGLVILLGRKEIVLSKDMSTKMLLGTLAMSSAPVFLIIDGTLSRFDGAFLLLMYCAYIFFIIAGRRSMLADASTDKTGLFRSILIFLFGIALLIVSAEGIIAISSGISGALNITPFIIGVFAIAFSTSLPELAFGIRAAFQGTPELSLADVVGSSAVNASGILGIVALIHPIVPLDLASVLFAGFFGIFVFVVFFLTIGKGSVRPARGAILLILYLIFASFHLVA